MPCIQRGITSSATLMGNEIRNLPLRRYCMILATLSRVRHLIGPRLCRLSRTKTYLLPEGLLLRLRFLSCTCSLLGSCRFCNRVSDNLSAPLRNAFLLSLLTDSHTHPGTLLGFWIHNHHIAHCNARLVLQAASRLLRGSFHVLRTHIDAGDNDAPGGGKYTEHCPCLALVLAGDHDDMVASMDFHTPSRKERYKCLPATPQQLCDAASHFALRASRDRSAYERRKRFMHSSVPLMIHNGVIGRREQEK